MTRKIIFLFEILMSYPFCNSLINMRVKDFFTEDLTYSISVSTVLLPTPAKSHSLRTLINLVHLIYLMSHIMLHQSTPVHDWLLLSPFSK